MTRAPRTEIYLNGARYLVNRLDNTPQLIVLKHSWLLPIRENNGHHNLFQTDNFSVRATRRWQPPIESIEIYKIAYGVAAYQYLVLFNHSLFHPIIGFLATEHSVI